VERTLGQAPGFQPCLSLWLEIVGGDRQERRRSGRIARDSDIPYLSQGVAEFGG
jgi:hypothetical protein